MKKNIAAPRALYVRRSVSHLCFNGKMFGVPKDDTQLDMSRPVRCARVNETTIKVSQLTSIGGSIGWKSETWLPVKFS